MRIDLLAVLATVADAVAQLLLGGRRPVHFGSGRRRGL